MICGEERMLEDLRLGCKALELIRRMVELDSYEQTIEECCGGTCYTPAYIELLNDMHALLERVDGK